MTLFMRALWTFIVVLVGLVLGGTVYVLVRDPEHRDSPPSGRALPRLPLDRVAAPLPPRFAGPLPTDIEGFQEALEKGPPLSYVRARLLEGDPDMEAKFLAALRKTADSAWNFGELWAAYGVVLGLNGHTGDKPPEDMRFLEQTHDLAMPCEWIRARLAGAPEESPFLTELLWRKLVSCPGAETLALFAREDAPILWVLDHHFLFGSSHLTPALEGAVRRILAQDRQELFISALRYLWKYQEPGAQALREELWRRTSAEHKAEWEQVEATREQIARWREQERASKCPSIPNRPEGVNEMTVQNCLRRWAESNWAATARFAMSASRSAELQKISKNLASLRHFSSAAELKAWARERSLLPAAEATPEEESRELYLSLLMREARRAFSIELRTRAFPRRHDELLVTLAWLVRPELTGVVFEQLPPKNEPPGFFEPPSGEEYTLWAYADGQRFSVQARNSHSLEDIGAVVGLLNQVLESKGSPRRFAVLDSHNSQVDVVFGPEASLREADALELWRLGDGKQVVIQAEAQIETSLRCLLGLGECPF